MLCTRILYNAIGYYVIPYNVIRCLYIYSFASSGTFVHDFIFLIGKNEVGREKSY